MSARATYVEPKRAMLKVLYGLWPRLGEIIVGGVATQVFLTDCPARGGDGLGDCL